MKVLLIKPSVRNLYHKVKIIFPPMGLMSLGAYLKEAGHQVEIKDLTFEDTPIDYSRADLVGFTCATNQYKDALQEAEKAKAAGKKVVMGGVHASFVADSTIKTGNVDYVIRGEGEKTLLELCNALEKSGENFHPGSINGLSWYDEETDTVVNNAERAPIKDIDSLPYPARDLVDIKKYQCELSGKGSGTTLLSSRGCPFSCNYCVIPNLNSSVYRTRSPKAVVDELEFLSDKYGFKAFLFVDDNVTSNPKRTKKICDEITKRGLDIGWWCQTRADTLVDNKDMVEKMAASGCQQVFVGFEASSERVLDSYNKSLTSEIGHKAVNVLKEFGIKIMGSFMIGEIDETKEEVKSTVEYAKQLGLDYAQFSILTPFPGTKLFERVKDQIFTFDWDKYDGAHSVVKLDNISPDEIEDTLLEAYKDFYLRLKWISQNITNVKLGHIKTLIKSLGKLYS